LKDIDNTSDFDIYARVIDITDEFLTVDKYMRNGAYSIGIQTIDKEHIDDFCSYYDPMTDKDLEMFQQGLTNLKNVYGSNDSKNTIQILNDCLKKEEIEYDT
jgi:hypothetical protein